MASTSMPARQIRAHYDDEGIIVYQAYNQAIATAAVKEQRLDASPRFSMTRMTWIKPSWCWMMYRSGYSYKDSNQARILAIKLSHAAFAALLAQAITGHGNGGAEGRVRVQWDPERNARIEKLEHRSIQIGIPGALKDQWLGEWTIRIEDVTERAREMKQLLDGADGAKVTEADLIAKGLMPVERPYEIKDAKIRAALRMEESTPLSEEGSK